ncbi:ATP-binding protein [Amycolatopsis acidicola]|uniref:ATP-binding protein n=1 Tax=Amycolatopsis acidicola TaxID=2596893 RepID=A0A5N0V1X8_9PSEU|nr:ATP-binding protein [Amycolatopsis acidicola]KAA9159768.1 ATP-binding protein [Amycolatopsis acidicola]
MGAPAHGERIERLTLSGLQDLGKVRDVARVLLPGCAEDDVIDSVLVADELCTLACEYGNLPAGVCLIRSFDRPSLRVAVSAPHLSLPCSPSASRTSRSVLESCATDWGIGNEGERMTLWAHVRVRLAETEDAFPVPRAPVG